MISEREIVVTLVPHSGGGTLLLGDGISHR